MAGIWHDMASKSLAVKKNHLKHKESPSGKKHSEKKLQSMKEVKWIWNY